MKERRGIGSFRDFKRNFKGASPRSLLNSFIGEILLVRYGAMIYSLNEDRDDDFHRERGRWNATIDR